MRNPSSSTKRAERVAAAVVAGEGSSSASSSAAANKITPCCTKVGLKRGPWTPEEDELLANYIKKEGEGRWRTMPKKAGLLRCGKSCRLRWMNYLRPSVKRGHIAPDEEDLILRLHRLLGNRWSLIAGRIPGRTDNEIKNYWNTHLSKKLISQGIDPRTHKPLEPNFTTENRVSTSEANQIQTPSSTNYAPPLLEFDTANMNSQMTVDHDDQYQSALTVETENGNCNFMQNNAAVDGNYELELKGSHEGHSNEDDEQDINCCTDEVFSSFLNSLINEDVFNNQNLVQQHQQDQMVVPNTDPLIISSTQAFTYTAGWDAPIMASTAPFDQHDPKRLNQDDHI